MNSPRHQHLWCYFPLQLPLLTSPHAVFITRRAWVFLQNSATLGFSLVPPRWRWHPKNCSKGSWDSFSLRKVLTPGRVNKYLVSSTNERTGNEQFQIMSKCLPVTLMPSRVSAERSILLLSLEDNSFFLCTHFSHSSRYCKNVPSNH